MDVQLFSGGTLEINGLTGMEMPQSLTLTGSSNLSVIASSFDGDASFTAPNQDIKHIWSSCSSLQEKLSDVHAASVR